VNTSYEYDNNGRLTALEAIKSGQTLKSYAQTFDAAGNITQLTENASLDTYFAYDEINRLTSEDIEGFGEISYAYDHAGNRTDLDNPVTGHTDYTYNEANQLTQTVNGSGTTDFTYNAGGALSGKTIGQDTTSYTYNGLDKLSEVVTPLTTVNYAYDALGRRISRGEGEDTRNIHHSAKSDLEDYETSGAGNLTSASLRGPDGLISQTDYSGSPATSYELYSPHGDLTAATDETGTVNYGARLDAFGNTISGGGSDLGHTGKWQRDGDPATGTIRMGVREYDPELGRFVSQDPLKGSVTDPQQRNRYPYVGNSPLNRYDLKGLSYQQDVSYGDDSTTYTTTTLDGEDSVSTTLNPGAHASGNVANYVMPGVAGISASAASSAASISGSISLGSLASGLAIAASGGLTASVILNALISDLWPTPNYDPHVCTAGEPWGGVHYREDIFYSEGEFDSGAALRDASLGHGNFGVGSATREEADRAGDAWVGPGSRELSNGSGRISADGRRVYRRPALKKNSGKTEANFERKNENGDVESNAHVDITD